jgi:glycosyltransferase involved in cell wall biosynthesis
MSYLGTCEVRVPTYRRPKLLRRALSSIVNQTYVHWRCIVLDDCRERSGRLIVEEMRDPRIKYLQNPQRLGALGNIDKAFARQPLLGGKYAFVLEDDNYLLKNHIENSIRVSIKEGARVVFCNQYCEAVAIDDEPGQLTNGTTLDWMYEPGMNGPDDVLPSLLFSHGFSNGAVFWRTDCLSDFQIGESTLRFAYGIEQRTGLESYRLLRLKDPVYVSLEATSVWHGREPQKPFAERKLSVENIRRLIRNGIDRVAAEREKMDYQCEVLSRLGTGRIVEYIGNNRIADFHKFRQMRVKDIERAMLLCGYDVKLTNRRSVRRMRLLVVGYMARYLIPSRRAPHPASRS